MILNAMVGFFKKKWKKTLFFISIIIFLSIVVLYSLVYYLDFQNCVRNQTVPHYSSNQCFLKYNIYLLNRIQLKCYSPINESYLPEINHTSDIRVDVYLLNSNLTQSDVNKLFSEINAIWNKFGVNFVVNAVNLSKANEKVAIYGRDEKVIRPQLEKYYDFTISENNSNVIMVICDYKVAGGLHFSHFTIISKNPKNRSWVMAHELGHIMGLYDKAFYSGEINLMTHQSCIQNIYYPTNLNKFQVERVMNRTAELYQSQNQET
jgi:hypothetical protein